MGEVTFLQDYRTFRGNFPSVPPCYQFWRSSLAHALNGDPVDGSHTASDLHDESSRRGSLDKAMRH